MKTGQYFFLLKKIKKNDNFYHKNISDYNQQIISKFYYFWYFNNFFLYDYNLFKYKPYILKNEKLVFYHKTKKLIDISYIYLL